MGKYEKLVKFLEKNLGWFKNEIGENPDAFRQGFIEGMETVLEDVKWFEKLEYYGIEGEAE